MVARLACDRPLIGVWPTIPSEVRFDSGDTGLGDRLLNALFAATLAKLGLFERVHTLWNDGSHAALFGERNPRARKRGLGWNISAVPYPAPITKHIRFPPELLLVSRKAFDASKLPLLPNTLVSSASFNEKHRARCNLRSPQVFPNEAAAALCARARHDCLAEMVLQPNIALARHPDALAASLRWLWPSNRSSSPELRDALDRLPRAVRCAHRAAARELSLISPQGATLPTPGYRAVHARRGERGINRMNCGSTPATMDYASAAPTPTREDPASQIRPAGRYNCEKQIRTVNEADDRLRRLVLSMSADSGSSAASSQPSWHDGLAVGGSAWYVASDNISLSSSVRSILPASVPPLELLSSQSQGMHDLLEFFALSRASTIVASYVFNPWLTSSNRLCHRPRYLWYHSEYTFAAAYVGTRSTLLIPAPACCTRAHYLHAYSDALGLPPDPSIILLDFAAAVQRNQSNIESEIESEM